MQRLWILIAVPALLLFLDSAIAENADDNKDLSSSVATEYESESVLLDIDAFEVGGTLSDDELNAERAREHIEIDQITLNDQDQDGNVTDNVANGNTNGNNLINGNAFSDSSGFLSTVQNTGNNVLIQNSTIINVSVETPTN